MDNLLNIDENFIKKVEEKFKFKKSLAKGREEKLFGVFNKDISEEENFALKFLYAYMPLHDMTNYDGELFLKYVRHSLNTREKASWGKKIPDYLFLYYVLAYRINNEDIDGSRDYMFEEIFPRISSLSMHDAILEVNHWCHEKANYISTDDRTASPSTCIRAARGRCGEESVLLVSALRSVGIPARQCYAPRWSHCDDNHAWVEAWADGRWHFLGACEPEPGLDDGWFVDAASRAMMVHTKVMGDYEGPEDRIIKNEYLYELNLLERYAPIKEITIQVKNKKGDSIKGANVHFQVYNYSEFADIACLVTDEKGEVSLKTGLGNLMIFAHFDKDFGYRKVSVKDETYVEICISQEILEENIVNLEMEAPASQYMELEEYSIEELNINSDRLNKEDEIRKKYEDSFIKEEEAKKLARELFLPEDRVWQVMKNSRGNFRVIADYLKCESKEYGQWCLRLLETLEKKDLIDISMYELKDHLYNSVPVKADIDEELYNKYILCPRIANEKISVFREFLNNKFTDIEKSHFKQSPKMLIEWIDNNIKVTEKDCYFKGMAYPMGTFEIGKADIASRDILFVAMARSFFIAARLNPYDKKPEFYAKGRWNPAEFEAYADKDKTKEEKLVKAGRVTLKKTSESNDKIEYFTNFTISRLENGYFKTLDFSKISMEEFNNYVELPCGNYRLITGNRLSNEKVKIRIQAFTVREDETTCLELIFPDKDIKPEISGIIDSNEPDMENLISNSGAIIMWVDADKEPSKHLMHEMSSLKSEFEKYAGKLSVLSHKDQFETYLKNTYKLPYNVNFYIDKECKKLNKLLSYLEKPIKYDFPLVFIVDTSFNIIYVSSGYKPERGNEILRIANMIK